MKNFKVFIFIICFLLSAVFGSIVSGQQDTDKIKIVTISAIQNEQTHELAKGVVREAYNKIGLKIEYIDLPARRALEWANIGKTDGDLARIDGTDKKFTNLIKILIPVTEFKGVAFTRKVKKDIQSWEDLKGLSIGIVGGIRYSEIGTKGLDPISADDMTHLFKLLSLDRIDVAIAVLDAGKIEIQRNYKTYNIHMIGRPLFSAPLFHFVHNNNKDIVPGLESAFLEMFKNGEIKSIHDKALLLELSQ